METTLSINFLILFCIALAFSENFKNGEFFALFRQSKLISKLLLENTIFSLNLKIGQGFDDNRKSPFLEKLRIIEHESIN